jgi:uncharacterized membrane protein
MSTVDKSIEVNVPVTTAYNQWTQFESFPQFMEGVHEVRQLDAKRLHWRAEVGGQEKEWEAEITEQVPDQVIAWMSVSGAPNGGTVRFQPMGTTSCRVDLTVEYEPEGLAETVGDKLGFMSRRVEGDLERFKSFVESRGVATGSWRGEIEGGQQV